MALQSFTVGDARFRAGSWRGSTDLAYLVPLSGAHTLDQAVLAGARDQLRDRGYAEVVTAAVGPPERSAFLLDDFVEHQRLHLLTHDLRTSGDRRPWRRSSTGGVATHRIQRGTRKDWPEVLALDVITFDDFWRLDSEGLADALNATPISRLRIARSDQLDGYSVTGRAGRQGYLQRLAVNPDRQGEGIGSALVFDALDWLRRRGATKAWVNTQDQNERALQLYEKLGFKREAHQLTVLQRELT